VPPPAKPALAERLRRIWETPAGIGGWLSTVDHKEIGIRYIITAFAFLIAGGVEALIFRCSWPARTCIC
jgi:heme/copper-type cytochrome/quinol oxidase subunit 1